MRNILRIFVHCTATRPDTPVETIQATFRANGWKKPGYHYLITREGRIVKLLDEAQTANGVHGYNATAIHVAYIGGQAHDPVTGRATYADTRTTEQKTALRAILSRLHRQYPHAQILGHRSIWGEDTPSRWKKLCPCFNAPKEYADL